MQLTNQCNADPIQIFQWMKESPIIVTGAAGFIGMHVCRHLLNKDMKIIGIDNLNPYYDVELKKKRIAQLSLHPKFSIYYFDICDKIKLNECVSHENPKYFIHLAAQAGVRYSLNDPHAYVQSNIVGFVNVLEVCRYVNIKHFIYASSSSVYGNNNKVPFVETDPVEQPLNLYAATKRSNELFAYSYSHLYGMSCTGLRFFSTYGPWGRPDMSPTLFARAIFENRPIKIFNHGNMKRDFTYIEDVVFAIEKILLKTPQQNLNCVPWKVFNVGSCQQIELMEFIALLEEMIGKKSIKEFLAPQKSDMLSTFANTKALCNHMEMELPHTPIEQGLSHFVEWVKDYYKY